MPKTQTIAEAITAAYQAIAPAPGAFVKLADLRAHLTNYVPLDIDDALRAMYRLPNVSLIPESNQKSLTTLDIWSSVEIGDQDKHLISIW